MEEEKKMAKKKLIIIVAIILIVIVLGIIVWLLIPKDPERDTTGTWELISIKRNGDSSFENTTTNEKLVVKDNQQAIMYLNGSESCKATITKRKIVCSSKTYSIVENGDLNVLYLADQNDNVYRYELLNKDAIMLKNGLSVSVNNWKLNMESDTNNTMVYPSIEELNNKNFIRPKVDDYYKSNPNVDLLLEIGIDLESKKIGDHAEYTFEIINDGAMDVTMQSSGAYGVSTDYDNIDPFSVTFECYKDINNPQETEVKYSEITFKSGEKLSCVFNVKNNNIKDPISAKITKTYYLKTIK